MGLQLHELGAIPRANLPSLMATSRGNREAACDASESTPRHEAKRSWKEPDRTGRVRVAGRSRRMALLAWYGTAWRAWHGGLHGGRWAGAGRAG
jgi:hypothetical protein